MGDLLRDRLAQARERNRINDLVANLRSGNVVTAETIRLAEKWGSTLEVRGETCGDRVARLPLELPVGNPGELRLFLYHVGTFPTRCEELDTPKTGGSLRVFN